MSFISDKNPCPCDSGLDYLYCCGAPDRSSLNLVAHIHTGKTSSELSPELFSQLDALSQTPEWFPVSVDIQQGTFKLVKMSSFWYGESTFLDANRILGTYAVEVDTEWLNSRTSDLAWRYTPIIFHCAFCGSTLISKALAQIYKSLPLREPDLLGSFFTNAESILGLSKDEYIKKVMALLSRRFEENDICVVKANDHSNAFMQDLLRLQPETPVLYMYVPLDEFVVACVKEPSRQQWISDRYYFVQQRLLNLFPSMSSIEVGADQIGKMAACYWAYNTRMYLDAHDAFSEKTRCLEFNRFLSRPQQAIKACAEWLRLQPRPGMNVEVEMKQLLCVYSKGGQAYSPEQRRKEIEQTLGSHERHLLEARELVDQLFDKEIASGSFPGQLKFSYNPNKKKSLFKRLFTRERVSESLS